MRVQLPARATRRAPAASRARGFTLVEILVVCVIIAVVTAGAILSLSVLGGDSQLDTERDRLVALMNYARDQAALETRELGLYCTVHGYRFLEFDPSTRLWEPFPADAQLSPRELPAGLELTLQVEGHAVVLGTAAEAKQLADTDAADLKPHIMIFSNGDLTSFRLTIERVGTDHRATLAPDAEGRITALANGSESSS
jgi:general secretion pathway protein H